jgi:hypothetical protein
VEHERAGKDVAELLAAVADQAADVDQLARMHIHQQRQRAPDSRIETILGQRKNNWIRRPDDPDQRWGASSVEEWKTYIAIAAKSTNNPQLPQQIGDPSNVFTNELVDEINNFDKAAVVKQAREFKI